jgi:hypothetical protein
MLCAVDCACGILTARGQAEGDEGKVVLQACRLTSGYYHDRTGLNQVRDSNEQRATERGDEPLTWAERMSDGQAAQRRHVQINKRQHFHELVASNRQFADLHGNGGRSAPSPHSRVVLLADCC